MPDELHLQHKRVSVADDLTWVRDMAGSSFAAENQHEWLVQHVNRVCDWIGNGLNNPHDYRSAVETVLDLLAVALRDERLQPCFLRVVEVVQRYPTSVTTPFQVDFQNCIAEFGKRITLFAHLKQAPLRQVDELLQAYIRLIRALSFNQDIYIQQDLVDQALIVSQRLDDHIENARLNQTLAHYYMMYGDMLLAEQHGKIAFTDYEHVEDAGGIADAACTLAIIYRVGLRLSKVEYYIERALKMTENKAQDKRFATLYYEKGALCYTQKEYHPAISYYHRALDIFEQHGAAHQVAMTQQAMAQAHLYLSHFDEAEALLLAARRSWEKLQNPHDLVGNHFIAADLELERGSYALGLQRLGETKALAYRLLDDTPARAQIIELIDLRAERYSMRGSL